ncbi:MAG: Uma2 family endonuclease [Thioploca sp.]|nr:Uma2 family endonuclease [Thioploca sp.]
MINRCSQALVVEDEEDLDVASWNHGWVQLQLGKTFLLDTPEYVPNLELSLDISQIDLSEWDIQLDERCELKPDVCLYPVSKYPRGLRKPVDILRMTDMPVLAIEILSPKQGIYDIKQKFKAYFALGISSCWLVQPEIESVTVYSAIDSFKLFDRSHGDTEIIDTILEIHLSLEKIFG